MFSLGGKKLRLKFVSLSGQVDALSTINSLMELFTQDYLHSVFCVGFHG